MALDRKVLRMVRLTFGVICLALGVIGLVLPILQGWLFLALGALLLSKDVVFFRRMTELIRSRFPGVDRRIRNAGAFFRRLRARL